MHMQPILERWSCGERTNLELWMVYEHVHHGFHGPFVASFYSHLQGTMNRFDFLGVYVT
jgi:hypothetical protein